MKPCVVLFLMRAYVIRLSRNHSFRVDSVWLFMFNLHDEHKRQTYSNDSNCWLGTGHPLNIKYRKDPQFMPDEGTFSLDCVRSTRTCLVKDSQCSMRFTISLNELLRTLLPIQVGKYM